MAGEAEDSGVGEQMVGAPLSAIAHFYARAFLYTGDEGRAAELTRREGFASGYATAKDVCQGMGFSDVGNLLHQMGLGSEGGFRVDEGDPIRITLEPTEHRFNKSYPCFWTTGYMEAIAKVLTGELCTADIVGCMSEGRQLCVYEIRKVPRRRLEKTTHKSKTAYSFPTEEEALENFVIALNEGRPGLAFTPRPTAETKEHFRGAELECFQIGDSQEDDSISPLALGTLDTVCAGVIRKKPEVAILLTAVPYMRRHIADPNLAALLHSLADLIEGPRSSAVGLVSMPYDLLSKFPQVRERYKQLGSSEPPRAYKTAPRGL